MLRRDGRTYSRRRPRVVARTPVDTAGSPVMLKSKLSKGESFESVGSDDSLSGTSLASESSSGSSRSCSTVPSVDSDDNSSRGFVTEDEALRQLETMLSSESDHFNARSNPNENYPDSLPPSPSQMITKRPATPCHRRSRSYFCGPSAPLSVMQV